MKHTSRTLTVVTVVGLAASGAPASLESLSSRENLTIGASREPALVKPRVAWMPPRERGPSLKGTLAVELAIEPGWHIYWPGQNDSGSPVEIELKLPEGWKTGPILWPAPLRHESPGDILDHVLEGKVTLLIDIDISPADRLGAGGLPPGQSRTINAAINWMVCKEACTVGSAQIDVAAGLAEADRKDEAALIDAARKALPKPLPASGEVAASWTHGSGDSAGTVVFKAAGASRLEFFPHADSVPAANPSKDCAGKGDALTVHLARSKGPDRGSRPVLGVLKVVRPAASAPARDPAGDSRDSTPTQPPTQPKAQPKGQAGGEITEYYAIDLPPGKPGQPGKPLDPTAPGR